MTFFNYFFLYNIKVNIKPMPVASNATYSTPQLFSFTYKYHDEITTTTCLSKYLKTHKNLFTKSAQRSIIRQ